MKFHTILLIIISFTTFSCKKDTKDTSEINKEQINTNILNSNTKVKPKYDLNTVVINQENVADFLTWYGENNKENQAIIETSFGKIEIQLFENTPLHGASFVYLIKKKYFNTTYFHRVVKNFIVQGGNSDETKTQKERKAIGKYFIPAEFNSSNKHDYGALAAARSWENNPEKLSTPFEFYFIQNKNGSHHLNNEHTVFGKITTGYYVLDKIAEQITDKGEYPLLNIKIKVSLK